MPLGLGKVVLVLLNSNFQRNQNVKILECKWNKISAKFIRLDTALITGKPCLTYYEVIGYNKNTVASIKTKKNGQKFANIHGRYLFKKKI